MHLYFIQGTFAVLIALAIFSLEVKYGTRSTIKYAVSAPFILFSVLAAITYFTSKPDTSPGWITLFFVAGVLLWVTGSFVGLISGMLFRKLKPNKALKQGRGKASRPLA